MWSLFMQPIKYLTKWLDKNANKNHYLFSATNLRALFPNLLDGAYKSLLHRAAKSNILTRVCRGVYLYEKAQKHDGLLLFHVAALLRAGHFNYVSLETVLGEAGVISQVPIQWITIMSSGRSSIIPCGSFGTIEFIHTEQKPADLVNRVIYDRRYGMWRADIPLAIQDMKNTRRDCDLINRDIADEFI